MADVARWDAVERALAVRERNLRARTLTDPPPWFRRHGGPGERPDLAELATVYGDVAVYRERWPVLEAPSWRPPSPAPSGCGALSRRK